MTTSSPTRVHRWLAGYSPAAALLALWLVSVLGVFWLEGIWAWTAGLLYAAWDTFLIAVVAWKTFHLRAPVSPAPPLDDQAGAVPSTTGASPSLCVLVPARNEASVLANTLDAVIPQLRAGDGLVVVDDGSQDATRALLASRFGVTAAGAGTGLVASSQHPNLQVLFKPNTGKAGSLNAALAHVAQPLVVTLDADTRLQAGALDLFRQAFSKTPTLAAAGGILSPWGASGWRAQLFQRFQTFEYLRAFLARAAWMHMDALLLVSGAFAAYRRDVLLAVGGFDASCLVEDYELIHRIHRHSWEHGLGWQVQVLPGPRASTHTPGELGTFLRQRRRWFAGFLQTQFAYRHLHGDARFGNVGRIMLPVKAVDTMQPVFGITAFVLLVGFLVSGAPVLPAVVTVVACKLVLDVAHQLWAVHLYHRWLGVPVPAGTWSAALLCILLEPFSFQLLRHAGAAWGWAHFLTGRQGWEPQRAQVPLETGPHTLPR